MKFSIKSWILVLLLTMFLPAHAVCDALDFPLSSSNTETVTQAGELIIIKGNNKVEFGGKTVANAYFNQTVEATEFPTRLAIVRKFKNDTDKDLTINFTVQTLTSQYHFSNSTLPTRTFAISELDDSGNVNCTDFFDSLTAVAGNNTYKKKSLTNPVQVYINERGDGVTLTFKKVTIEAGKTYQFEFISQGEKSALNNSVVDEEYRLIFGKTAKVDLDGESTVVDDDLGVYFAEDSSYSLLTLFGFGELEVGITSPTGAAAREFDTIDDEIPADDYTFQLSQEKLGKKFLYTFIDETGAISPETSAKPFISFQTNSTGSKSRGIVTIKDDRSQVKQEIKYLSSRTADKFLDKQDARAKAIIKVNLLNKDETDVIADGFTNITLLNFDNNSFVAEDVVIEVEDPSADIPLRNMFVSAIINDVDNTPNGSYNFELTTSSFEAVVIRDGKTLNLGITENPINLAVTTSSVFVVNGVVPDEERGVVTIEVNQTGKDLLDELEEGDEVYITFTIASLDPLFGDDYGIVILRKTGS